MTPAEIAAKLTPAQARALFAFGRQVTPHSANYHDVTPIVAKRLEDAGLLLISRGLPPRTHHRSAAILTLEGRAVLAVLDGAGW